MTFKLEAQRNIYLSKNKLYCKLDKTEYEMLKDNGS